MSASPSLPAQVIAAFGTLEKTSEALRRVPVSTIHGWKRKGRIPPWRYPQIVEAARREGIQLPEAVLRAAEEAA